MPGLYAEGDYDLAGFAVGAVERGALLPKGDMAVGDLVFGLPSSGVHSNGFSLVRKIATASKLKWSDEAPFAAGQTLAEALLTPTRIYVKSLLRTFKETAGIKALAHITGGGLVDNLPRILPDTFGIALDLSKIAVPQVFRWLAAEGNIMEPEMLRTFNCGIGMVVVAAASQRAEVEAALRRAGEDPILFGEIVLARDDQRVFFSGRLDL
jgi:phosphoribosylformylglycinamidine cyclo-ligase